MSEVEIRTALGDSGFRVLPRLPLEKVVQREKGERLSNADKKFLQTGELDFVIANAEGYAEFAVEFDGPTHNLYEKKKRSDIRKNRICSVASLPLVRITDIHLKKHEKTTLLGYIVRRFISWQAEKDEIVSEIEAYVSTLPENEFASLTEGGILDPSIDPGVLHNLRHPFPGIQKTAERLLSRFGIVSLYLPVYKDEQARKENRWLEFTPQSLGWALEDCDHVLTRTYKLTENADVGTESICKTEVWTVKVIFRCQWMLPIVEDYNPEEAPVEYLHRTGILPVFFSSIPGSFWMQIAENFCDYLSLSMLEEWALENLVR